MLVGRCGGVRRAGRGGRWRVGPEPECSDPEDDNILALAVDAHAEFIVSNDTDLTSMSPWRGRPIMTPCEFVQRINVVRNKDRGEPTAGEAG